MRRTRRGRCLIAVVCAVLGSSAVARAQRSSTASIRAGRHVYAGGAAGWEDLVGGAFTTLGGGTGTTPAAASAGSTPTARSTPASIQARTRRRRVRLQPDGKILVGGIFTTRRRHAAQPDRPAQRRRVARHHLRSRRQRHRLRHGGAAGREDPGRRHFSTLGGGSAQPDRPARRRAARSTPASIRERTISSTPSPSSPVARFSSAAPSRRWAAADSG